MGKWKKAAAAFCCGLLLFIACCGCDQKNTWEETPPGPMKSITRTCGEYTLTCDIPEDWEPFTCSVAGTTIIPSRLLDSGEDYTVEDTISILRYDFSPDEKEVTQALFEEDTEPFQTFFKQTIERAQGYKVDHFSFSFDDTDAGKLVTVEYDLTVPEETFVVYHYVECYLEDMPYCVSGAQNEDFEISPHLFVPWIAKTLECTAS